MSPHTAIQKAAQVVSTVLHLLHFSFALQILFASFICFPLLYVTTDLMTDLRYLNSITVFDCDTCNTLYYVLY